MYSLYSVFFVVCVIYALWKLNSFFWFLPCILIPSCRFSSFDRFYVMCPLFSIVCHHVKKFLNQVALRSVFIILSHKLAFFSLKQLDNIPLFPILLKASSVNRLYCHRWQHFTLKSGWNRENEREKRKSRIAVTGVSTWNAFKQSEPARWATRVPAADVQLDYRGDAMRSLV